MKLKFQFFTQSQKVISSKFIKKGGGPGGGRGDQKLAESFKRYRNWFSRVSLKILMQYKQVFSSVLLLPLTIFSFTVFRYIILVNVQIKEMKKKCLAQDKTP